MKTEIEVKFYPVDGDRYREKLLSCGAKLLIPERKFRRVMGDRSANPQLGKNDFVRVRDEGEVVRLSFKRSADESGLISDQKEIDVEVSDFSKTIEIMKLSGFKFNRFQETVRETWTLNECEVVIDWWPGLDPLTEIEGRSEKLVKKTADILGFDWNKRIITSAVEVYMKVYGLSEKEVLEKVSNINFDNNPFSKLPKKWSGD